METKARLTQAVKSCFKRCFFISKMKKEHVMISGVGRSGTTCLVHLMTALGLDTGFKLEDIPQLIDRNAKAGLEWDVRKRDAPFICKSPWFSEHARSAMNQVTIKHIIIPIRDFHDAAQSRIRVTRLHQKTHDCQETKKIPGGLVFTDKGEDQIFYLQDQFIRLINTVADYHVPVTFLSFPRFANDPKYLYEKLGFLFKKINYKFFLKTYSQVIHSDYIHTFK